MKYRLDPFFSQSAVYPYIYIYIGSLVFGVQDRIARIVFLAYKPNKIFLIISNRSGRPNSILVLLGTSNKHGNPGRCTHSYVTQTMCNTSVQFWFWPSLVRTCPMHLQPSSAISEFVYDLSSVALVQQVFHILNFRIKSHVAAATSWWTFPRVVTWSFSLHLKPTRTCPRQQHRCPGQQHVAPSLLIQARTCRRPSKTPATILKHS